MFDLPNSLIPSLVVTHGEFHVVTVVDRATELLYGALLNSGQQVLRFDSYDTLNDLFTMGGMNSSRVRVWPPISIFPWYRWKFWLGGTEIGDDSITGLKIHLTILVKCSVLRVTF